MGTSSQGEAHLLEPRHLADMGTQFLHILTTMKHNGAIDKTRDGFTALVQRFASLFLLYCLAGYAACFSAASDLIQCIFKHDPGAAMVLTS